MIGKKNKAAKASSGKTMKKVLAKVLFVLSILIFIGAGAAWWLLIRNTPENTFQAMLNNNLRTASVTRTVTQDNGYQKLEQIMRIQNRTEHVTNGTTTLTQGGGSTTVVTESVGLPNVEYIKYNSITTTQKDTSGESLDFSEVFNVWGQNKAAEDQLSSLYQDVTIGNLFMFADLDSSARSKVVDAINTSGVYDVDYENVKKTSVDGRPKYLYKVKLKPQEYIAMIKLYSQYVGLTQFAELDPADYKDSPPVTFVVTVDVLTQRVDGTKSGDGANTQTFSGYGIIENVEIPTDFIPASELQQRLTQRASA